MIKIIVIVAFFNLIFTDTLFRICVENTDIIKYENVLCNCPYNHIVTPVKHNNLLYVNQIELNSLHNSCVDYYRQIQIFNEQNSQTCDINNFINTILPENRFGFEGFDFKSEFSYTIIKNNLNAVK